MLSKCCGDHFGAAANQPLGGGLNSTVGVGIVTLATASRAGSEHQRASHPWGTESGASSSL
jgi:hypothetical protein